MGVKSCLPHTGHTTSSCWAIKASISSKLMASTFTSGCASPINLSALWRALQLCSPAGGLKKPATWPVVTHVCGFMMMAASSPTLYGLSCTNFFHQARFTLFFEFHAEGAVIPRVRKAAVNFTARINKASVFAQGYYFFHFLFVAFHSCHLFLSRYVLLYGGTAFASSILLDARLFFFL